MSYKHNNIRDAVQQVVSLHSMIAMTNDELARARETYSPTRYQVIEAEKLQEFRNARSALESSVRNLKQELTDAVNKQDAALLLEHGKDPYIQLLNSGAILTADELANILNQNPSNPLLLRNIESYASARNINDPHYKHALNTVKAALAPESSRQHSVDMLASYLINYAPDESAFANPQQQKNSYQMFAMINNSENKLFETLDNSI